VLTKHPSFVLAFLRCYHSVRYSIPGALRPLSNIKHLGSEAIFIARRPLSDLFPSLESLSAGRCCRLEALRRPSVDRQGADAGGSYVSFTPLPSSQTVATVPQVAVPAAAAGAPAAAGVVRPGGDWLNFDDICSCHHLKTLELSGSTYHQVLEAWNGGLVQIDMLSRLR
jgi:hypothetical protein